MIIPFILILGVSLMAHDGDHGKYLSDEATVDTVYGFIQSGEIEKAVEHIKGSSEDDQKIAHAFVSVQCDINNVKHDPVGSAALAQHGVAFMQEKGFKRGEAMMLHNISAFFMPDWDENAIEGATTTGLAAARQQVPVRKEIGDQGPLMWAHWDLGMCLLVAGEIDEAIKTLEEGEKVAIKQDDKDGAAWCRIFIGKAKVKYKPELKNEGEKEMLEAAKVINEVGADWEKEEIPKILASVGLKLD